MEAVLDTTVLVHLLRRYQPALNWLNNNRLYGVAVSTWLEIMAGSTSKVHQVESRNLLSKFELLYLTPTDQQWAMEQLERFQFSHHIGKDDCLIAAFSHRLQVPLYTHNLKDMTPLIGSLAIKPY